MNEESPEYADYVDHPRYGRGPRITGLDFEEDPERLINFWIFPPESRIPNTAVLSNTELQKDATFAIPVYFDQKRMCLDCGRPFIWFAEEQKFWYEELGFYVPTDCTHCVHCRQRRKGRPAKANDDSRRSEEAMNKRHRSTSATSFPPDEQM